MIEDQKPRRVVPPWRPSWISARTAEARTLARHTKLDFSADVANKELEFRLTPSVPIASELMFLATQAGNEDAAREAAALIVSREAQIGGTRLVHVARKIIENSHSENIESRGKDFIREARKLLAIDFRNPILLIDIARELTVLGHEGSALRYVRTAIGLAPQSRFVVRSAARYFLHIGDHEQAHAVLKRTPLLRTDSWIQASEIAVATVRNKTSTNTRQAIKIIDSENVLRIHLSELASAVATVEFLSGSNKKAKHLFQKALANPTDNSLAQAEWAATKLKLVVDKLALQTPMSFEANFRHAYRALLIPEAIGFAKQWADDEQYASRPLHALSFLYSLDGQYKEAHQAVEDAIKVDGSKNFALEMNRLFTGIQCGDVNTAYDTLLRLAKKPEAKSYSAHLLANAGALAYATGDQALGREFYQRAIQSAKSKAEPSVEALARAFFARAATIHSDPNAQSIVEETARSVERLPSPGAIHITSTLVDEKKRKDLEAMAQARVATRKWEWDAATNTLRSLN